MLAEKRLVTKDKARQILGKKAEGMSDKQIEAMLNTFYSLSCRVINQVISKGNNVE